MAAGRGRGGRFSAGRKREVVLRLLRGEDLESVSRAVGITAARASHWRAQFLAAGQAGRKSRAPDGGGLAVPAALCPAEVDAMSGAQSIATRRASGVQRVCRVWHRARSSVSARRQATRSPARCRRRGPIGAAPDDVLVAHLRRVLEGRFMARAEKPGRSGRGDDLKERVRRLMREHDLQAPPRAGHAHGPKAHDGTITTVMWGTDMTATVTVADGLRLRGAAKRGTRFEALEPIRHPRTLRGHRRVWAAAASRPRVELLGRRYGSSASKARASCGSPKATASRSASSAR